MTELSIFYAVLLGLLGSAHCLGMCGGISSAIAMGINQQNRHPLVLLLSFNTGRIFSYAIAGGILGGLGWLIESPTVGLIMRTVAGLILILLGLYIARWWQAVTYIEGLGKHIWKYIQPFTRQLLPVSSVPKALLLGSLWGWLPCGLVYSTLIWSASAADWQTSAMLMAGFGLGTIPAMLVTGLLARQLQGFLQHRLTQATAGLCIIGFGIYTLPLSGLLQFFSA